MAEPPLVAVLAAGRGSRFGGGKLDAQLAGQPVGTWALQAVEAAGLAPGLCITGPEPPAFLSAHREWERLANPDPARGLSSSLALAARAAMAREAAALLVTLADMPCMAPAHLARLAAAPDPAATPHGARAGVPALFGAAHFAQLAAMTGDRGAGPLLAALEGVTLVEADAASLIDVDRPRDLARAERILSRREG